MSYRKRMGVVDGTAMGSGDSKAGMLLGCLLLERYIVDLLTVSVPMSELRNKIAVDVFHKHLWLISGPVSSGYQQDELSRRDQTWKLVLFAVDEILSSAPR